MDILRRIPKAAVLAKKSVAVSQSLSKERLRQSARQFQKELGEIRQSMRANAAQGKDALSLPYTLPAPLEQYFRSKGYAVEKYHFTNGSTSTVLIWSNKP